MFVRMLKLPRRYGPVTTCRRSSMSFTLRRRARRDQTADARVVGADDPRVVRRDRGNGIVYCNSEQWLQHPGTVGARSAAACTSSTTTVRRCRPGAGHHLLRGRRSVRVPQGPGEERTSRHAKGWRRVGDVGYVDEEGYLFLTDRKSHMIISGGAYIYPQETENVLVTHPKVVDVAVSGCPTRTRRRGQGHRAARRDARRRRRGRGAGQGADRLLAATAWPTSSAHARWTSAPSSPATRPASSTSATSKTSTGTPPAAASDVSDAARPAQARHGLRRTPGHVDGRGQGTDAGAELVVGEAPERRGPWPDARADRRPRRNRT